MPSPDEFYKANGCVLTALKLSTVHLNVIAVHSAYTANRGPTYQFAERASHSRNDAEAALTATQDGEKVFHPILVIKLHGVTCRALLDTGATASHAWDTSWIY